MKTRNRSGLLRDYSATLPSRDVRNGRQIVGRIEAAKIAGAAGAMLETEALPLLVGWRNTRAARDLERIIERLRAFEERNSLAVLPRSIREKERRQGLPSTSGAIGRP
jgi:hypothetical protein